MVEAIKKGNIEPTLGPVGLVNVLTADTVISDAERASQAAQAATQASINLARQGRQETQAYKDQLEKGYIPL